MTVTPSAPVHHVTALVNPPQSTFELACAAEVFGTRRAALPANYTFSVCTEQPGPVPTLAGYDMLVTDGLSALDTADTVLVPGWRPAGELPSQAVTDALRRAHRRGARVVSICSGAFALAAAGLLDGRSATTHWARAGDMADRFPAVRLDPDVLYVDHGDVATSAGAGAGIDLCLHLVRSDHGAGYAAQLARYMVMPPHREGGQLQYAAPPLQEGATAGPVQDTLALMLDWAKQQLGQDVTVDGMARYAGVSSRTLARRFDEQLGVSPGRWLLAQRVAASRVLLEETDLPVESIAGRVGLTSATNLRRRFRRSLNTTPAAYRRAFRGGLNSPPAEGP